MKRNFILGLVLAGLITLVTVSSGLWSDFFNPPESGPRATATPDASAAPDASATSNASATPQAIADPEASRTNATPSVEAAQPSAQGAALPGSEDARERPAPPGNDASSLPASADHEAPNPAASTRRALAGNRVLVFWESFLTEQQALRFASLLSEQSQVDVRVEGGRGEHRVAFDFQDEADLNAKIDRIESATRLDLRGAYHQRLYLLPEEPAATRGDAMAHAEKIGRATGTKLLVVRTRDGFVPGVAYAREANLTQAMQSIESLSGDDEPAEKPADELAEPDE